MLFLKEISEQANLKSLISDIVSDYKNWLPENETSTDLQKMVLTVTNNIHKYFDKYAMETDMNLVNEKWDTIIETVAKRLIKRDK